jgi:hypothetical protein
MLFAARRNQPRLAPLLRPIGVRMRVCGTQIFVAQSRIWHRIESTFRKWPATPQPPQRQPTSAPRTVQRDCFLRVLRARRIKFAGPAKKRRKKNSVQLHESQQQPLPNARKSAASGNRSALKCFVAALFTRPPFRCASETFRRCFRRAHVCSVDFTGGFGCELAFAKFAEFTSVTNSRANAANFPMATLVRGWTTMSHPVAISCRCCLNISRNRRRIRLRRTAFPNAFLMLQPNRLTSKPLGRTNSVNSRLLRRRPSRYTASYSARRTSRVSRGRSSRGGSDAREGVAPFFAACGKDFSSTLSLHAFSESVFFVAAPHVRLISAFRQRKSPLNFSARSPTDPLRDRRTQSKQSLSGSGALAQYDAATTRTKQAV